MSEWTHLDDRGASRMVDVTEKDVTARMARASGRVVMSADTLDQIRQGPLAKGNVLEVARLAGIMAAKKTADLIPLCHPLPLEAVELSCEFPNATTLQIESVVRVAGRTGVEMEALVAVSIAALTVYDMCKSLDRAMTVEAVQLEEKSGGRSGHYRRSQ